MNALFLAAALLSAAEPKTEKEQDVASGLQAEGVEKAKYNDIERGFGVRLNVGMLAYVTRAAQVPAGETQALKQNPGMLIGMELAYDIAPVFDLGVFFYFATNSGQPGSTVNAAGTTVSVNRDISTGFGGLMARFSFFHTERLYLGVKAGAGYGFQDNRIEALAQGIAIPAAITAEYFTRIRHFSLALDVGALFWVPTSTASKFAVGITAVPSIKYTF